MPFVQIKVIEGVLPDEKKKELLKKVSEAVISVGGEGLRPALHVVIEEIKGFDWAIGAKPLSADDVNTMVREGAKKKLAG